MESIIEGIKGQSGVAFYTLTMNLFLGFVSFLYLPKNNIHNYFFSFFIFLLVLFKLKDASSYNQELYLNLIKVISFPIVYMALPFYRKLFNFKFVLYIYILFLIVFFTLDIPFLKLFSRILIPNYSTQITFVAGISNIFSLFLISYNNSRIKYFGKYLFFVTYLSVLFSLAKWLLPVILISPLFYYKLISSNGFNIFMQLKKIIFLIVFVSIIFVFRDFIAQYSGYGTLKDFIDIRITKSSAFDNYSIEQESLFGIGDGNRFNIFSTIINDYLKENIFSGLTLDYRNAYNVPAHNIFVFYISILGMFGMIYCFIFIKTLFSFTKELDIKAHYYIVIFMIITVLFNFLVGESYGNIILLTFIFINLITIKNNVLYSTID